MSCSHCLVAKLGHPVNAGDLTQTNWAACGAHRVGSLAGSFEIAPVYSGGVAVSLENCGLDSLSHVGIVTARTSFHNNQPG